MGGGACLRRVARRGLTRAAGPLWAILRQGILTEGELMRSRNIKKLRVVGHGRGLGLRTVGDWEGEPLEGVLECCRLSEAVKKALREQVLLARRAGHSWAEIGGTLGVSKQAAWERFGKADPDGG